MRASVTQFCALRQPDSIYDRDRTSSPILSHLIFGTDNEPVSDIDTVVVDSLKALDPEWPIREADILIQVQ